MSSWVFMASSPSTLCWVSPCYAFPSAEGLGQLRSESLCCNTVTRFLSKD